MKLVSAPKGYIKKAKQYLQNTSSPFNMMNDDVRKVRLFRQNQAR